MKDNNEDIIAILHRQNALLEMLMRHSANQEAALAVLAMGTIPEAKLAFLQKLRDRFQDQIYDQMISETLNNNQDKD